MRRFAALVLCACGPTAAVDLSFTTDKATFDGRSERAIVTVSAADESGAPGVGIVELTTGVGSFVEGTQVVLVAGRGSATFRCLPAEDAACAGSVRLGASWKGEHRSLTIKVTPSDPRARPLWRVVPTMVPVTLYATARAPDQVVWAVGERGTVMPYLTNGTWGAPLATGVTSTLRAVVVDANGSLTIVGDDGVVLTGVPPTLTRLTHDLDEAFTAVARPGGQLVVGTALGNIATWQGRTFVSAVVSASPINAITEHQGGLFAAGDEGIFTGSNGFWAAVDAPVPARWVNVLADADGIWLLGRRMTLSADSILVRGPGPEWKSASLPSGAVRAMAWGAGTSDRYVATDVSVFRQQVGTGWEDLEAPAGGNSIVLLGGTSVLVVGPPGVSLLRVR